MDTSFKDYSELYKWASEGKPIEYHDDVFKQQENDKNYYSLDFTDHLDRYQKVFEKKKVTLYRHTYRIGNHYSQTNWRHYPESLSYHPPEQVCVKTESKEIELD